MSVWAKGALTREAGKKTRLGEKLSMELEIYEIIFCNWKWPGNASLKRLPIWFALVGSTFGTGYGIRLCSGGRGVHHEVLSKTIP